MVVAKPEVVVWHAVRFIGILRHTELRNEALDCLAVACVIKKIIITYAEVYIGCRSDRVVSIPELLPLSRISAALYHISDKEDTCGVRAIDGNIPERVLEIRRARLIVNVGVADDLELEQRLALGEAVALRVSERCGVDHLALAVLVAVAVDHQSRRACGDEGAAVKLIVELHRSTLRGHFEAREHSVAREPAVLVAPPDLHIVRAMLCGESYIDNAVRDAAIEVVRVIICVDRRFYGVSVVVLHYYFYHSESLILITLEIDVIRHKIHEVLTCGESLVLDKRFVGRPVGCFAYVKGRGSILGVYPSEISEVLFFLWCDAHPIGSARVIARSRDHYRLAYLVYRFISGKSRLCGRYGRQRQKCREEHCGYYKN